MPESEKTVQCSTHGASYSAYICTHLYENPKQEWFCDNPAEDNQWPDAWCAECDRSFQEYGEWNEHNENDIEIRLICHQCYERRKGESVVPLMEAQAPEWKPFLQRAMTELNEKQDRLQERYELSRHERWDYDQGTCELTFSNQGVPAVIARFQYVGSVSEKGGTWLWSWANFSLLAQTRSEIVAVREFGEARGFACLTVPKWPAEEVDGWEMAAVAASVLDAEGVYRVPTETGFSFLLLMDVRKAVFN